MEMLLGGGGGDRRFPSGLDSDTALPRKCSSRHAVAEELSQTEPFSRATAKGPFERIRRNEKGHVSVSFFIAPGETSGTRELQAQVQAGCLGLPEDYKCQTEQAGAKQQQG